MQQDSIFSGSKPARWLSLILTVAIVLWLPAAALADIVSGRIFGPDEKPIVNGTFIAKNSKGETTTFKTNAMGNFSVYLDPGRFTVSPSADATLSGVIESLAQPRQSDVHLKKSEGK